MFRAPMTETFETIRYTADVVALRDRQHWTQLRINASLGAALPCPGVPTTAHALCHGWNRHRPSERTSTLPSLTRTAVSSSMK
ncbi:hypothetical protein RKD18_000345 [Streptomyces phaeoluteigriseus]